MLFGALSLMSKTLFKAKSMKINTEILDVFLLSRVCSNDILQTTVAIITVGVMNVFMRFKANP